MQRTKCLHVCLHIDWNPYGTFKGRAQGPIWFSVHVNRPANVPHYAVWKVYMRLRDEMQWNVYMEVLTDSHTSFSVYEWDHNNHSSSSVPQWDPQSRGSHVYMTIDTRINFFFYYTAHDFVPTVNFDFVRQLDQQLEYDERLKVSNKIPRLDNYTFYGMRQHTLFIVRDATSTCSRSFRCNSPKIFFCSH